VLKIRLQRTGRKGIPFYRVVVAEHKSSVKGKYVAQLGFYNPLIKPWQFNVDNEKIAEWIKKGATPSNTVARLLKAAGVKDMEKFIIEMKDRKKKSEEAVAKAAPVAEKKEETPSKEEK
jgi:small subunit ribosomal protein S16